MPVIARLSVTALLAGLVLLLGTGSPAATPAGATNPPSMDAMSLDMEPFNTPANTASSLGSREPCARVNENDILDADEDVTADQVRFDLTALNIPGSVNAMSAFTARITYPAPDVTIVAKNNAGLLSTAVGYTGIPLSDSVPDTDGLFQVDEADLNESGVSGSGFLMRLTLETTAGAVPGAYALVIANGRHGELNGNFWPPDVVNHGLLVIGSGPFPDCTDADGDGYPGGVDNCPALANPAQTDTDGDGLGNDCDADDDGDLVYDTDESGCGSDPMDVTPPLSRPERIDGAFAGVDDDGDTLIDEALAPGAASFDCDGDGYKGSAEASIYSPSTVADQDPCGGNGWPSDLASPANKISISDVTSFTSPPPKRLATYPPLPGYNVRWDLRSPFGSIVLGDITILTVGLDGSPNKPPMLAGVRAFNGPACPWPP